MDLTTLITALDNSVLTRMVQSSNSSYGNMVTWHNADNQNVTCTINTSTTYTSVTNLCLIVKNNATYLYVTCNNQKYYNKVAISTITSISITSS